MKQQKEKVYISGPITGTNDYMTRFGQGEGKMKALGYDVINPAQVTKSLPESTTHDEYMAICRVLVPMADAIYMMKGWENSEGAREELELAQNSGIMVLYEKD